MTRQLGACVSAGFVVLLAAILVSPVRAQGDPRRAAPPPDRALVFIYRSDARPLSPDVGVIVNAERVGRLANETYLAATVPPGKTSLHVGDGLDTAASFEAAAGRTYFVRVRGIHGQKDVATEVELVGEAEGRGALEKSLLAGSPAAVAAAAAAAPAATARAPSQAAAAPQPAAAGRPAPQDTGRGWSIAVIPMGGAFKLDTRNQLINTTATTYDTKSKSVWALDVEWRGRSGFAAGGEFFGYKNDLAFGTTGRAQQQVAGFMVNAKYYLGIGGWFYPFIGAGIGGVGTDFTGGITGNTSGFAYQGLAGVEFRFKHIGLYLQYKSLNATTKDDNDVEVKVGGQGSFAGISIIF